MSSPQIADHVKMITSVIYAKQSHFVEGVRILSKEYGDCDYISEEMPFEYTKYYEKEMGTSLKRRFVFYETLIPPEILPDVKHFTNNIEGGFTVNNKRQINIDPGYISMSHLILATGKSYAHRPYLRDGIWADLTLIFREQSFQPLPWSYPDYREQKNIDVFNKIRRKYMIQLKDVRRF